MEGVRAGLEVGAVDDGLGDAVGVDQARARAAQAAKALVLLAIPDVRAGDEHAHEGQVSALRFEMAGQLAQHRGHELCAIDGLAHHQRVEVGRRQ
jgi:hypothetical protein